MDWGKATDQEITAASVHATGSVRAGALAELDRRRQRRAAAPADGVPPVPTVHEAVIFIFRLAVLERGVPVPRPAIPDGVDRDEYEEAHYDELLSGMASEWARAAAQSARDEVALSWTSASDREGLGRLANLLSFFAAHHAPDGMLPEESERAIAKLCYYRLRQLHPDEDVGETDEAMFLLRVAHMSGGVVARVFLMGLLMILGADAGSWTRNDLATCVLGKYRAHREAQPSVEN